MLALANLNAAFEIVDDAAQVLDEQLLLGLDHRDQPFMISLAAARAARW